MTYPIILLHVQNILLVNMFSSLLWNVNLGTLRLHKCILYKQHSRVKYIKLPARELSLKQMEI